VEEGLGLDQSVMRFRINFAQKLLALFVALAFLALSITIIQTNKSSLVDARHLTAAEAPAASIIFTQRETLVYTVRLSQWLDQQVTRRDVQIARALLAQRLAVVNSDGTTVGGTAPPGFLEALHDADKAVASANPGILTTQNRAILRPEVAQEIDNIVAQARLLVTNYQLAVDNQLIAAAKSHRNGDFFSLLFLIIFLALALLLLVLLLRSAITQYRRSKNRILLEGHRLRLLAQELEETNLVVHELKSLNESKNEFISNISHELRTPLTSIIGYVDLLSTMVEPGVNPALDNSFKVLDRNASILLSLVQSLLSLSQLESPNNKFALKPTNLVSITEDAIFLLQTSIERKELSVQFKYDESTNYLVTGDAGLLSQMVINLVSNAVKFSHQGKILEISLHRHLVDESGGNVVLTIRDHGIGIPADEIDHLFERFYRASNAVHQQIQGTGLGLAIVAKVAQIHGAKIEVNSQLGDGTSITVEFPDGISRTQALIENRKFSLLAEAIEKIHLEVIEDLRAKLHEYGGALGFYDFAEIGEELLVFSRSLAGQTGEANSSVIERRDQLIAKMRGLLPPTETGVENGE